MLSSATSDMGIFMAQRPTYRKEIDILLDQFVANNFNLWIWIQYFILAIA